MKVRFVLPVLALVGGFLAGYLIQRPRAPQTSVDSKGRRILYWVDPMHPSYKSDRPGIAPDCGMKLEPVYAEPEAPEEPKGRVLYWRDPQDPDYRSDKPGLNPETGNVLEPVYEEGPRHPPGTVHISPEKQQLIGVTYGRAEIVPLVTQVRALGRVAYDETRLVEVHARVEGWVETVFVNFTGQRVAKGDPLLTVYSPELLASQSELLLAARAREILDGGPLPKAGAYSRSLMEAARKRLELWDVSPEQIRRVLETGEPIRSVTIYAPADGYVLERRAFPSQKITPETKLYTLADLSRVWILAEVFESDAPRIREGQPARVRLTHGEGRPLKAQVSYVQPGLDPVTRTLKVRLEAPNPDLSLKPEMFVEVELDVALGRRLTAPVEAVLDSGVRKTVFVDRGNGYLEPREVETGEQVGDRIVIRKGLRPGERVVTSANFLIDSESQLKAALGAMGGAASPAAAGHQHGGHQHD
jgi:RND family efflux transporter MFP subunit